MKKVNLLALLFMGLFFTEQIAEDAHAACFGKSDGTDCYYTDIYYGNLSGQCNNGVCDHHNPFSGW